MTDLETWKERLKQEMDKMDILWTPFLDEAWDKSSGQVQKEVAELVDTFFQYYWDLFDSFCSETSQEKWQEKASRFHEEASSSVADAWDRVAEQKKDQADKEVAKFLRNLFAKTRDVNQRLRVNLKKFEKAKEAKNSSEFEQSISKFREVTEEYESAVLDIKDARKEVRGEWILVIVFGLGSLYGIIKLISWVYAWFKTLS